MQKNNNKDKQKQAYEQALIEWDQKHNARLELERDIQDRDSHSYNWRVGYLKQLETMYDKFQTLFYRYEAEQDKENMTIARFKWFGNTSWKNQYEDEGSMALNSLESEFSLAIDQIHRELYGQLPSVPDRPQLSDFNDDGINVKANKLTGVAQDLRDLLKSQRSSFDDKEVN